MMGRLTSRRTERVGRPRAEEVDVADVGSVLGAYAPELLTDGDSHVSAWVAQTDHTAPRASQSQDQEY
jgi:hypothetical protein